jgi:hypothetical protein
MLKSFHYQTSPMSFSRFNTRFRHWQHPQNPPWHPSISLQGSPILPYIRQYGRNNAVESAKTSMLKSVHSQTSSMSCSCFKTKFRHWQQPHNYLWLPSISPQGIPIVPYICQYSQNKAVESAEISVHYRTSRMSCCRFKTRFRRWQQPQNHPWHPPISLQGIQIVPYIHQYSRNVAVESAKTSRLESILSQTSPLSCSPFKTRFRHWQHPQNHPWRPPISLQGIPIVPYICQYSRNKAVESAKTFMLKSVHSQTSPLPCSRFKTGFRHWQHPQNYLWHPPISLQGSPIMPCIWQYSRNKAVESANGMGEVREWTLLSMEVLADSTASALFHEYWQIYGIIGLPCRLIGGCHGGF